MHYYIDESGHTGRNIFDNDQKTLYYGLLACESDMDEVAGQRFAEMRAKLGVAKIHATKLGNGQLIKILPELLDVQSSLDISFSVHSLCKPEHVATDFFDVVFNCDINPAVPPAIGRSLDNVILRDCVVGFLFTPSIARAAWEARINKGRQDADAKFRQVCVSLLDRADVIPYPRLRAIFQNALSWAIEHSLELAYPVQNEEHRLAVMPNIIGFQLVLHQIAAITAQTGIEARRIIVDEQLEFNIAQQELTEFYTTDLASEIDWGHPPEVGHMDLANMPKVPLEFDKPSCGLEFVDILLWLFKRVKEGKPVAPALMQLLEFKAIPRSHISIQGQRDRWASYFDSGKSDLLRDLARGGRVNPRPSSISFNILGRSF